MKISALLILLAIVYAGCASAPPVYYEIPRELRSPQAKEDFIASYSPYIKGEKFFIDPGHGGADRNNKGFEGKVVEADANLNVALALRDYLKEAGATVFMSRDKDTTVDLKYRSVLANNSGADVFISVHHNAPGRHGDIYTNFSSTFYHATDSDFVYEPCNRDIARYVQRDMAYAMRNSGGLGSFDGTYSDYDIYPGAGFSVLRRTNIPAVLVECGFNTHRLEGLRLLIKEYNKIEAWGIFKGLCKYFKKGIPEIEMHGPDTLCSADSYLAFTFKDSSGIDPGSVIAYIDSAEATDAFFDKDEGTLSLNLAGTQPGVHTVRIIAANKNGNHSFPYRKKIVILNN